jgi:hypothetical protein
MTVGRNERCSCGSGYKIKHCCGALFDETSRPSRAELELLAIEADDEGIALGEEPKQRAFVNVLRMTNRLGLDGVVLVGAGSPPIMRRIHDANDRLFRPVDIQEGGVHLGFFMFRDIFAQFSVPVIFGKPSIDFIRLVNLSDDQKKWMGSDKSLMEKFEDQAFDLFDFGYGWMEFGHARVVSDEAKEMIYRSHTYLEAAAATATSAYDFRGTVQSALIGAELALKAGLAGYGLDNEVLRKVYGHNLAKSAKSLGDLDAAFDVDRVVRAVSEFPDFARSRYAGSQPTRIETGDILMKAQYVASEVTRLFTDRNMRKDDPAGGLRTYPE